ncbi:MAG: SDR family oxidoreductase [Candidatus Hydrogenedentes bacterium]|nr:SDR family oxidoreductase [Candidatus Hydrogenedentota bacterium]
MTDPVSLAGKTALVTGGAKRIGAATCLALAKAGSNVVVHYRHSAEEAKTLRGRLETAGVSAWTAQADLAESGGADRAWEAALRQAGHIDFLVNSASIFPTQTLTEMTPEDVHRNLDVNALAPMLLCRRFAEQKREGAIVNLLDTRAFDYDRNHVPYHLSKRMLFTLTRIMAVEYAPSVRVNAVAPGLILPPEGKDQAYLEQLRETNPLHRIGSPEDVAEAVLFLLRSSFMTGQVLLVDGGRHLHGSMYG